MFSASRFMGFNLGRVMYHVIYLKRKCNLTRLTPCQSNLANLSFNHRKSQHFRGLRNAVSVIKKTLPVVYIDRQLSSSLSCTPLIRLPSSNRRPPKPCRVFLGSSYLCSVVGRMNTGKTSFHPFTLGRSGQGR